MNIIKLLSLMLLLAFGLSGFDGLHAMDRKRATPKGKVAAKRKGAAKGSKQQDDGTGLGSNTGDELKDSAAAPTSAKKTKVTKTETRVTEHEEDANDNEEDDAPRKCCYCLTPWGFVKAVVYGTVGAAVMYVAMKYSAGLGKPSSEVTVTGCPRNFFSYIEVSGVCALQLDKERLDNARIAEANRLEIMRLQREMELLKVGHERELGDMPKRIESLQRKIDELELARRNSLCISWGV